MNFLNSNSKFVIGYLSNFKGTKQSNCSECNKQIFLEIEDYFSKKIPFCFECLLFSEGRRLNKLTQLHRDISLRSLLNEYGFRYEKQPDSSSLNCWLNNQ